MPSPAPRQPVAAAVRRLRRAYGEGRLRGTLFDGALLVGYLLLFDVLGLRLDGSASDRAIGVLLLVAVGSQAAGAAVKREPLRARRARTDPGGGGYAFLAVLLLLHFILFTVATLLAFTMVGLYAPPAAGSGGGSEWWIALALGVGAVTTGLVWGAARPVSGEERAPRSAQLRELVADGLLLVSILLMTQFFWATLVVGDLAGPSEGFGLGARGIVVVLLLSILFVVFYLPSRLLILVEDRRSRWTWIQLWLTMVPIAWSVLS